MPALSGQKTVTAAGTAEALGDQSINTPIAVKALAANTGLVFIGSDGAGDVTSANGFQLAAGEQVTFEFVGNPASLWIDVAVNGEGVCWIVLNA